MGGAVRSGGGEGDGTGAILWRFALAVYAADGVEAACIKLQDRLGVDVVALLYLAFVARWTGQVPGPDFVALAVDLGASWHKTVVKPLRHVRRSSKARTEVPPTLLDPLRATIKEAELMAERVQFQLLAEVLPKRGPGRGPGDAAEMIETTLALALASAGIVPDDDAGRMLSRIAAASAATSIG